MLSGVLVSLIVAAVIFEQTLYEVAKS